MTFTLYEIITHRFTGRSKRSLLRRDFDRALHHVVMAARDFLGVIWRESSVTKVPPVSAPRNQVLLVRHEAALGGPAAGERYPVIFRDWTECCKKERGLRWRCCSFTPTLRLDSSMHSCRKQRHVILHVLTLSRTHNHEHKQTANYTRNIHHAEMA